MMQGKVPGDGQACAQQEFAVAPKGLREARHGMHAMHPCHPGRLPGATATPPPSPPTASVQGDGNGDGGAGAWPWRALGNGNTGTHHARQESTAATTTGRFRRQHTEPRHSGGHRTASPGR